MTDLIVGCYTNYNWDQIKHWANSIDQSGFKGDKAVVVFNSDFETVEQLLSRNFNIFAFNRDDDKKEFFYPAQFSIVVQRFFHLWQYVNKISETKKYKNIITTDVKDVVFQSDPSVWLKKNLGTKKILVSSESLLYKDEDWGAANMQASFPMLWQQMMDKTIYNCGVLAGDITVMKDLFLNIFLTCLGLPGQIPGGGGPDQAALNILLSLDPWNKITKFATSEDGWACQAGTTADPLKIEKLRPHLIEPEPLWDGEFATTSKGQRFAVLHQYDRIPTWKETVQKKYD